MDAGGLSLRLGLPNLSLRKPKPTWENPVESISEEVGKINAGKHTCWEPTGRALDVWNEVRPQIKEFLDEFCRPNLAWVILEIYMIGKTKETSAPTILICSADRTTRKTIRKQIKEAGLLNKYPGFGLGDISEPPGKGRIARMGGDDTRTMSSSTALSLTRSGVIYTNNPTSLEAVLGRCFATYTSNGKRRSATGGPIVWLGGKAYQLTVGHFLRDDYTKEPDAESIYGSSTTDECSFDGDSDSDQDTAGEEGVPSSGSRTPDELLSRGSDDDEQTGEGSDSTQRSQILHPQSFASPPEGAKQIAQGSPSPSRRHPLLLGAGVGPTSSKTSASQSGTWVLTPEWEGALSREYVVGLTLDYALVRIKGLDNVSGLPGGASPRWLTKYSATHSDKNILAVIPDTKGSPVTVKGRLSPSASYIRYPGSRSFQEVFSVQLDKATLPQGLADGVCGSPVIDEETGHFCGHVVAGTPGAHFAFILPATRTLEDIEQRFGCKAEFRPDTNVKAAAGKQREKTAENPREDFTAGLLSTFRLVLEGSEGHKILRVYKHYGGNAHRFLRLVETETTEESPEGPDARVRLLDKEEDPVVPLYAVGPVVRLGFDVQVGFDGGDRPKIYSLLTMHDAFHFQQLITGYKTTAFSRRVLCRYIIPPALFRRFEENMEVGQMQIWEADVSGSSEPAESRVPSTIASPIFASWSATPSNIVANMAPVRPPQRIDREKVVVMKQPLPPVLVIFVDNGDSYKMLKLNLASATITESGDEINDSSNTLRFTNSSLESFTVKRSQMSFWGIQALTPAYSRQYAVLKSDLISLSAELRSKNEIKGIMRALSQVQLRWKGRDSNERRFLSLSEPVFELEGDIPSFSNIPLHWSTRETGREPDKSAGKKPAGEERDKRPITKSRSVMFETPEQPPHPRDRRAIVRLAESTSQPEGAEVPGPLLTRRSRGLDELIEAAEPEQRILSATPSSSPGYPGLLPRRLPPPPPSYSTITGRGRRDRDRLSPSSPLGRLFDPRVNDLDIFPPRREAPRDMWRSRRPSELDRLGSTRDEDTNPDSPEEPNVLGRLRRRMDEDRRYRNRRGDPDNGRANYADSDSERERRRSERERLEERFPYRNRLGGLDSERKNNVNSDSERERRRSSRERLPKVPSKKTGDSEYSRSSRSATTRSFDSDPETSRPQIKLSTASKGNDAKSPIKDRTPNLVSRNRSPSPVSGRRILRRSTSPLFWE
ncbi:hypothetical protein QBC47DRAFT_20277 [Echria macrotheca]|uniref:Uncharacterized protein n=1 Tax=Echria macrotheca TaxID=438768 RepID=A0AAJ0FF64_9PEZI|nr:hypothetical protein QBC47DRAFT_20277 [Echria macrotheca]